jgi:hypothetical protein
MKTNLPFLALLAFTTANAQLTISPNPTNINSGLVKITYGANADWSIFNANSDPNLYLYTGLDTDGVASTWEYSDTWNNLATLVPLTWNTVANAYVANVNIGTKNYSSLTLPNGTQVYDWFFIIRNAAGNSQSATLKATNYGFTAGPTLSKNQFYTSNIDFSITNGKMNTSAQGKSQLEIYALDGKKISETDFENNSNSFEIQVNLNQKGVFLAKLKSAGTSKTIKFIN